MNSTRFATSVALAFSLSKAAFAGDLQPPIIPKASAFRRRGCSGSGRGIRRASMPASCRARWWRSRATASSPICEAVGFQDNAKTIPMKPDAIFWIASMTKPVTSVAAMMLVEEGKLDLDAPVSRYLPELKDMQVGVEKRDPATGKKEIGSSRRSG